MQLANIVIQFMQYIVIPVKDKGEKRRNSLLLSLLTLEFASKRLILQLRKYLKGEIVSKIQFRTFKAYKMMFAT